MREHHPRQEMLPNPLEGKRFFPPVRSIRQILACEQTIRSFLATPGGVTQDSEGRQVLAALANTFSTLYESMGAWTAEEVLEQGRPIAAHAIHTTIAALHRFGAIDEMHPLMQATLPAKNTYARSQGNNVARRGDLLDLRLGFEGDVEYTLLAQMYLTPAEVREDVQERIRAGYTPVESISALRAVLEKGHQQRIVLTRTISRKDIQDFFQTGVTVGEIAIPVLLDEEVGGMLFFSRGEIVKQTFGVRSDLPRQDIWAAFLRNGQPAFLAEYPTPHSRSEELWTPEEASEKVVQLLSRLHLTPEDRLTAARLQAAARLLTSANREQQAVQLQARLERRFARRYARQRFESIAGLLEPSAMLTRSGVSANELAIRAIAHMAQEEEARGLPRRQVYPLPGWYYENDTMPLPLAQSIHDASVFLLNIESVVPLSIAPGQTVDYAMLRTNLIRHIVQAARSHPKQTYYVVIDKTTDPTRKLFADALGTQDFPGNVVLLETMSMTKHQKGDTDRFSGFLLNYRPGNAHFADVLRGEIAAARATVTPWELAMFPRTRPVEIQQAQARIAACKEVFMRSFQEGQGEAAQFSSVPTWRVEDATAYSVNIVPPIQALVDRFLALAQTDPNHPGIFQPGTAPQEQLFTPEFQLFLSAYAPSYLRSLREAGEETAGDFELGDSFGLRKNRVADLTSVPIRVEVDHQTHEVVTLFVSVERLSPGLLAHPDDFQELGQLLGRYTREDMEALWGYTTLEEALNPPEE